MKKILISVAGIFLALFLVACEQEPVEREAVARPIKMMTLGEATSGGNLEFPGVISASQSTDLGFEVSGQIIEFPVDEGQEVEKGDILARLDPRDYQDKLDIQASRLKAAEADYERYKILVKDGWVSEQEFEKHVRNFESAQSSYRTAEKALDDTSLRAPFSGNIARKIADEFQNIQAKEAVLIIHDVTSLQVVVNIPERDFVQGDRTRTPKQVTEEINPRVLIASLGADEYPAYVKEVATLADPTTRTYSATFGFSPPEGANVLPGMTARLIVTPKRGQFGDRTFKVPVHIVAADENGDPYVWIFDPETSTVQKRLVKTGQLSGENIEILSGISAGETVAVTGIAQLREGLSVRPLED